ncbi:MAG: sugar phosphate isomerase/epimerase [Betaproteobacteria bacterium]
MSRDLSLAALTVLELAPPDMVSCAAEAGYSHVGLRLIPATADEPSYAAVGDVPMVREIERRLAATGVRVLDIEIFRLQPETDVRAYLPALETGARLGARHALVAGNDPDEARLAERLAQLCALGAPLGIAMNLEPMPWTDVRNVSEAARIVARADSPDAGVLVDAIHFDRGGDVPESLVAVPRVRLHYAQLCDAPAERPRDVATLLHQARAERLMPGDGGLDLASLLRALPREIPLALEIPMRTLARTMPAVERARRMRDKARRLLDSLD